MAEIITVETKLRSLLTFAPGARPYIATDRQLTMTSPDAFYGEHYLDAYLSDARHPNQPIGSDARFPGRRAPQRRSLREFESIALDRSAEHFLSRAIFQQESTEHLTRQYPHNTKGYSPSMNKPFSQWTRDEVSTSPNDDSNRFPRNLFSPYCIAFALMDEQLELAKALLFPDTHDFSFKDLTRQGVKAHMIDFFSESNLVEQARPFLVDGSQRFTVKEATESIYKRRLADTRFPATTLITIPLQNVQSDGTIQPHPNKTEVVQVAIPSILLPHIAHQLIMFTVPLSENPTIVLTDAKMYVQQLAWAVATSAGSKVNAKNQLNTHLSVAVPYQLEQQVLNGTEESDLLIFTLQHYFLKQPLPGMPVLFNEAAKQVIHAYDPNLLASIFDCRSRESLIETLSQSSSINFTDGPFTTRDTYANARCLAGYPSAPQDRTCPFYRGTEHPRSSPTNSAPLQCYQGLQPVKPFENFADYKTDGLVQHYILDQNRQRIRVNFSGDTESWRQDRKYRHEQACDLNPNLFRDPDMLNEWLDNYADHARDCTSLHRLTCNNNDQEPVHNEPEDAVEVTTENMEIEESLTAESAVDYENRENLFANSLHQIGLSPT